MNREPDKKVEPLAAALKGANDPPRDFRDFYVATSSRVLTFLAKATLDPDLATELTAESFATALSKRHQFRGRTDREAVGWIFSIARRKLLAYQRSGQVSAKALHRLQIEAPVLSEADRHRVERLADLPGIREDLRLALSELPMRQRQALTLRVVNERPYVEIATILNMSEQSARKSVSRALSRLRTSAIELEEYA